MTEQEVCRHCSGTGKITRAAALDFSVGTLVWWNTSGYGYKKRIPAKVVAHSKSGKTARVRYMMKRHDGTDAYETMSTVQPHMLEIRHE